MLREGPRLVKKGEFRSFKMRKLETYQGIVRVNLKSSITPSSAYGTNRGPDPENPGKFLIELTPPAQEIPTGKQVVFVRVPAENMHIARSQAEVKKYKTTRTVRIDKGARISKDKSAPIILLYESSAKLN